MEKEFVPYEQALALKELGFDEPCFGYYKENQYELNKEFHCYNSDYVENLGVYIAAPLYQQAFSFFREKYKLYPEIGLHDREDEKTWRLTISILGYYELAYNQNVGKEPYYKTYEEAELACLTKLIEIVKTK
jgi:hypothetical protein